ncbi:MAG TPA: Hsp33 family molecular chaperone HslO [Steroidobacteraceae bacterium]|nr:Hsp33 family molecular chaperone HslO [Steroidobacteraceae bacterium]
MTHTAAPPVDLVHRFIFEHQPVRGHWVRLDAAWRELRAHQQYPPAVRDLLGEAVTAAVLLAASLKFEGTLTLQLEGDGAVRLLVAQCTNDFRVRAVPRFDAGRLPAGNGAVPSFRTLVGAQGRLTVTIEAAERDSRYQGVVPLSGASLSESLEAYFADSEQLPTQVRLIADDSGTAGLLVQKLPGAGDDDEADGTWRAAQAGAAEVDPARLLADPIVPLLERAFPGRDVRLFRGSAVRFECGCSPERVSGVLRSLGEDEVRDILREHGVVAVTCEFCQRPYRFDAVAIDGLFGSTPAPDRPSSLH